MDFNYFSNDGNDRFIDYVREFHPANRKNVQDEMRGQSERFLSGDPDAGDDTHPLLCPARKRYRVYYGKQHFVNPDGNSDCASA